MVDTRIRQNERCVVGLPSCGYFFSSTRRCFIAYGFQTSALEKDILRSELEARRIEAVEAEGTLDPAQYVFCTKICSKIITAQFCIVIINNDVVQINGSDSERPNPNVNMEYGLMIGHNKFVIPFQKDNQSLPFNVAGLDTIKYNQGNFRRLASAAIDQAIEKTTAVPQTPIDQTLQYFCLSRDAFFVDITGEDRTIYLLGDSCGFKLLQSLDGMSYIYFGVFFSLRPEHIIWRLSKIQTLIVGRYHMTMRKIELGLAPVGSQGIVEAFIGSIKIWIIVDDNATRTHINEWISKSNYLINFTAITVGEMEAEVQDIHTR